MDMRVYASADQRVLRGALLWLAQYGCWHRPMAGVAVAVRMHSDHWVRFEEFLRELPAEAVSRMIDGEWGPFPADKEVEAPSEYPALRKAA